MGYNKTQLDPDTNFEKHVFHRDQFAHYLRWSHVLREAEIGQKILDFGCGSGNMLEVFYRNRFRGKRYLGLDVREKTIIQNRETYKDVTWADWLCQDLCGILDDKITEETWDIIGCFEVFEHIGKKNGAVMMWNLKSCMGPKTRAFVSTPCYDPKVGAADNHIIDGEVGEFTYQEFKDLILGTGLKIKNHWGTFASIKDYKEHLNEWQKPMFEKLKEYYDPTLVAVIMAPFFPERSRNCIWELTL